MTGHSPSRLTVALRAPWVRCCLTYHHVIVRVPMRSCKPFNSASQNRLPRTPESSAKSAMACTLASVKCLGLVAIPGRLSATEIGRHSVDRDVACSCPVYGAFGNSHNGEGSEMFGKSRFLVNAGFAWEAV